MADYDIDIDIRIVMENQGFEEEPVYTISREFSTATASKSSTPEPRPNVIHPNESSAKIIATVLPNFDTHVYEDISPGAQFPEDVADRNPLRPPSPSSIYEDNPSFDPTAKAPGHVANGGVFNISKSIPHSTNDRVTVNAEVLKSFHRTFTLPYPKSRKVSGLGSTNNSSVRVTNREKVGSRETEVLDDVSESLTKNEEHREEGRRDDGGGSTAPNGADRHSKRRKRKDCKHCKNKMRSHEDNNCKSVEQKVSGDSCASRLQDVAVTNELILGSTTEKIENRLQPIFSLPNGRLPNFSTPRNKSVRKQNSVQSISNNVNNSNQIPVKSLNYDKNDIEARVTNENENKALITPEKNRTTMKVNSIYSPERRNRKETPIFVTDTKEHNYFQRAYSLPTRTQTPSSQNRLNLRRSVRGEPPPHPARLDKHRRGWTLHFARPLNGTGCTRSVAALLVLVFLLLVIGGAALYIVFEPEKLQGIQQYLMSASPNATTDFNSSETVMVHFDDLNNTTNPTSLHSKATEAPPEIPTIIPDVEPEPEVVGESNRTETTLNLNSTRYCDDCVTGEVCVALPDDEVPICRTGPDYNDPTGCAGLCLINDQRCHRLDKNAFRCVDIEHHCLKDEWTCSNALCIPLVKHCDGHMNCYDHSDEHNCVCNLETHFHCGNDTSCLPIEKRCDRKIDCWDATDEINCTVGEDLSMSCPLETEFTCSNGQCILKARFCDGLRDCADGSDEPHGCQGRCNKQEYSCQNGRCITKGLKCNGVDDCGDGTDEQHCRKRFT